MRVRGVSESREGPRASASLSGIGIEGNSPGHGWHHLTSPLTDKLLAEPAYLPNS
jgi:hypothetical protein